MMPSSTADLGYSIAISLVGSNVLISAGATYYTEDGGFGFVACTNATSCENSPSYYAPTERYWAGWSIAMMPGGMLVALGDIGEGTYSHPGWVTLYACDTLSVCNTSATITAPSHECTYTNWISAFPLRRLTCTDADNFAQSVALTSNYLAVGANAYDGDEGIVYLYSCAASTCTTTSYATIVSSQGSSNDGGNFGAQISAIGGFLAVAAPFKNTYGGTRRTGKHVHDGNRGLRPCRGLPVLLRVVVNVRAVCNPAVDWW
jgi:hypothetical protein